MRKITNINLKRLRNDELENFVSKVVAQLDEILDAESRMMLVPLKKAYQEFVLAMNRDGQNYREQLLEADAAADQAYMSIAQLLRINLQHYDENVRDAAENVQITFGAFENPVRLPYKEEYARMADIIAAMRSIPVEVLDRAMVRGWLDELERRCNAFTALSDEFGLVRVEATFGLVANCRSNISELYEALSEQLFAMAVMKPNRGYDTAIDAVNAIIEDRQEQIKQRVARNAAQKAAKDAETKLDNAPVEVITDINI